MKIQNSISFYILTTISIVMVLNNSSIPYKIIGLILMIYLLMTLKNSSKESIYDLLGITYLQKKFKNNKVIMEMTKE